MLETQQKVCKAKAHDPSRSQKHKTGSTEARAKTPRAVGAAVGGCQEASPVSWLLRSREKGCHLEDRVPWCVDCCKTEGVMLAQTAVSASPWGSQAVGETTSTGNSRIPVSRASRKCVCSACRVHVTVMSTGEMTRVTKARRAFGSAQGLVGAKQRKQGYS